MGKGIGDFADFSSGMMDNEKTLANKVVIYVQKFRGRKWLTVITNLADDLDKKKIMKALKKSLKCNGAVKVDDDKGETIQLQGSHGERVKEFLVSQEICLEDEISISGISK